MLYSRRIAVSVCYTKPVIQLPARYACYLFDMDGTLVNTEPIGPYVFQELFTAHGIALTAREKALFVTVWRREGTEIKQDDYLRDLASKYTVSQPLTDFVSEFYERYKQAIVNADELPGASDFLAAIKHQNKRIALVTSSKRQQAEAILAFHHWQQYFDCIVTEEDITNFKPDPEPYILAMNTLSAKPNDCIVFEDAKNGVIAGRTAGAFVIGLRAGNDQPQDLTAADEVVTSFKDISFA